MMGEMSDKEQNKKEFLKELLKELHQGAEPEKIQEKFKEAFRDVTAPEIAKIEEELINEGMPAEEIKKFCNVHIALFRESLEREKPIAPAGHPIHILMEEHKLFLEYANEFRMVAEYIKALKNEAPRGEKMKKLKQLVDHFKESESHYLREENVLFPSLEKQGITQPPAMMWTEHDQIRKMKKRIYALLDAHDKMSFPDFADRLEKEAVSLAEMLSSHFYKENNILFPTALKVISQDEFKKIREQFDELGYCRFTPESVRIATEKKEEPVHKPVEKGMVAFETGTLSFDQIEAVLNTLPVEVTFVDQDDTVRYFSQPKDKIFLRTKAVLGLKVQQCHPQKSVHLVNHILEDFKSGRRDVAEFWLTLKGRLVYIRYFAVRNQKGEYQGCLEVTQNITEIKKIQGEKRLL